MLAGQHEAYLLRQIRAIAGGRRDNAHPEMQRRVSRYTDAQLQAVVDFAARLPGPERAAAK
jgi:cytochrome c553